jgi:putative NIF3 family GTP cyclohydrolase 1 type 2
LGNNARLGRLLGIPVEGRFGPGPEGGIAMYGSLPEARSGAELAELIQQALGRAPLHIPAERPIRRLGWCSGGAQGYLELAADLGLDAFISGEISEPTTHLARERGIHYFAAGHHATERYGVQALGEHLAQTFDLHHGFVDIDNPA